MNVVRLHPLTQRRRRSAQVMPAADRAFQFPNQPTALAARTSVMFPPLAVGPGPSCFWLRPIAGSAAGLLDELTPVAPCDWPTAACPWP